MYVLGTVAQNLAIKGTKKVDYRWVSQFSRVLYYCNEIRSTLISQINEGSRLLFFKILHPTVGFWCQAIHKKFLQIFDTSFEIKMMVKIYVIEIILKSQEPFQSYQLTSPGWIGWAS